MGNLAQTFLVILGFLTLACLTIADDSVFEPR